MKTTGKILRVEYGYGLNREGNDLYGVDMKSSGENVWGVTIWLKVIGIGVFTDFIGVSLSDYPTDEQRFRGVQMWKTQVLVGLLSMANKRLISELVGVPIEIEHQNGKLLRWNIRDDTSPATETDAATPNPCKG